MRKYVLPVLVLLVLALALTACGGSDSTSATAGGQSTSSESAGGESTETAGSESTGAATQDESEIEAVIVDSVTRNEAAKCSEDLTQNFLEQTNSGKGKAALEECEAESEDETDDPDEVDVTEISVDGSKGTANAAFVGGPLDGQAVEIALVEDGTGWKLDELVGFAALDKEALAKVFEERLEAANELSPAQAKCLGEAIRNASETQLEELVLDQSDEVASELGEGCQ